MSVVNCKEVVPEYLNLKEWTLHPNHEYIGDLNAVNIYNEDTREFDSFPTQHTNIFINPFKVGKDNLKTRQDVVIKYKEYITSEIQKDNKIIDELLKLKNKVLGCWCYPDHCHGDILLELINHYSSQ